jgi:hypothetical protein
MGEDEKSGLAGIQAQLENLGKKFGDAILSNFDATRFKTIFDEVEKSAFDVAKSFGVGRTNILNIKAAMTDVVGDAKELGFNFGSIAELQKGIAEDLGRNVILNNQAYKGLLATQKVTGQDAVSTAKAFKDVGFSYLSVEKQMTKAVNISRKLGVNAQGVAKDVVANLDKLDKYNFKGGVEGLAQMVAKAKVLRADMDSVFRLADSMFEPEKAIEMSAALQRLGVTQSELLDPLRMMDMAQNDPGELMNQIGKMSEKFVQLNKDGRFEIMPGAKRQMMEIAKAMDIPYGELTKMAVGSKELDMKLSKIKFPATFTEDQKNLIANMSEIGPGGEMTLTLDGTQMGIDKAMETFAKDKDALDRFMKDSEPKSMEELAKDQLTVQENQEILLASIEDRVGYGLASSKALDRLARGQISLNKDIMSATKRTITEGGVEKSTVMSEKGIREGIGVQSDKLVTSLMKGDFSKAGEAGMEMLGEVKKGFMQQLELATKAYENSETYSIMSGEESKGKTQTPSIASGSATDKMSESYLDKLQKKVVTESNQNFTYNGKLDVNFTAPPGVNSKDVEKIINDIINSAEFKQKLAMMANDPTGKMNPSQQNMSMNNTR